MATGTANNPITDLHYHWLTVLQSRAEGRNACDESIRDAEGVNARECVDMFRQLQEQDARRVQRVRDHLIQRLTKQGGR